VSGRKRTTASFRGRGSRSDDSVEGGDGSVNAAEPIPVLTTQAEFADLVEAVLAAPRVALDTEFHREGTYYPKVALLQLATEDRRALVDPLAVDIAALRPVLESDVEIVMHASRQDLEILKLECGITPRRLVDTQVAAGFVGYSNPSLAALLERELGVRLGKEDRLTDWMRRPLSNSQKSYALADVDHLLQLWDRLRERLIELGRLDWAEEAFRELTIESNYERDPDRAWLRIRELRHLRPAAMTAAQRLAAWRERTAASRDVPIRSVLSDMAIVGLAQARPTTAKGVAAARGVESRNLRGQSTDEIVATIRAATGSDPRPYPSKDGVDVPADLKPAVTLVTAWISQLAKDLELDPATLGTRADVEAFVADNPEARLAHGWRAEVAGNLIRSLVEGRAAVAFEPDRGLVLVDRNGPSTDVVT
jgi:ribonuclease D